MSLSTEDVNAELKRLDEPLRSAIINRIAIVDALTEWGYAEEADALVDIASLVVNRWLVASQEQTPDIMISRNEDGEWPESVTSRIHLYDAQGREVSGVMILDYVEHALAALVGFHPQPEGDDDASID